MKFFHLADLHLGKRLHGFSLMEEQQDVLHQVLDAMDREQPDALLLAGDIYDKPQPPAEAVQLFGTFLTQCSEKGVPVLAISGNHDSAERFSFAGDLLCKTGVYVSKPYDGSVHCVTLADAFGKVDCYLLPFLKPAIVRAVFPEEPVESYQQAVQCAIHHLPLQKDRRNVLLAHQMVTGSTRSESEDCFVGGVENVDASVFAPFDYVALGHLHQAQEPVRGKVRYAGAPLCYAVSERVQDKTITVVELDSQGDTHIRMLPICPKRAVQSLRGSYMELTARSFYAPNNYPKDYVFITLTDAQDIPNALERLRAIYPYLIGITYERAGQSVQAQALTPVQAQSPMELFADFFQVQQGCDLNDRQRAMLEQCIEAVWQGEEVP